MVGKHAFLGIAWQQRYQAHLRACDSDTATAFGQNGQDTDVVVRLPADQRANVATIGSIDVQAESALRQAGQAVAQAQVAYDNARQAEVTGIQAVVRAQALRLLV